MVSQVYNTYMPNIVRPKPHQDKGQDFNSQQQSQGLATVAEQHERNKIHLNTILQDFRSTMDALGADETVRGEVDAYLGVVSLQSEKSTPSVPFIRQTLKTAADSLDGFIGHALGQPSRVVRDWVEALLLQNIEYRGEHTPTPTNLERPWTQPAETSTPTVETRTTPEQVPTLAEDEKTRLKGHIQHAKILVRDGDIDAAVGTFELGLQLLEGKARPDLEGKILNLMGRSLERAGRTEAGIAAFAQAEVKFGESGQWDRQAQLRYELGAYHDERGQLGEAQGYYEGALNLHRNHDLTPTSLDRILNDLGVVHLRQGKPAKALQMLNEATGVAAAGDGMLLTDIYSNLGALHRLSENYPASAQAYQQSLKQARQIRDKESYTRTLVLLADVYDEAGRPDKAQVMRDKLTRVS